MKTELSECAGVTEGEVLKLAAEAGLNEKAFAEGLQSSDTPRLASGLAAACMCHLLLKLLRHSFPSSLTPIAGSCLHEPSHA